MYVIQYLEYPEWNHKWAVMSVRFATLKEAQAAYDKLPIKHGHRIMEEYTVTRYKAVKS
jgi:hypothetical protein